MTRPRHIGVITAALACLLAGAVLAPQAAKGALTGGSPISGSLAQCFHTSDISAWRAADPKTIYLRVSASRYYRIDLSRECAALHWPDARLITHTYGSGLICAPVDLNLRASEGPGDIPEPCFVKSLTALSSQEAALLPKQIKP